MKALLLLGFGVVGIPILALSQLSTAKAKHENVARTFRKVARMPDDSGLFSWSIVVKHDKRGIPSSVVYLVGNKHRHFIAKVAGNEMKPMSRETYAGWNVPAKAITACFGWFAGGGDLYYAITRPHLLRIYHRSIDESDPEPQKPTLVKSIKL